MVYVHTMVYVLRATRRREVDTALSVLRWHRRAESMDRNRLSVCVQKPTETDCVLACVPAAHALGCPREEYRPSSVVLSP